MKLYIIGRQTSKGVQLVRHGPGDTVAAFADEDAAWKVVVEMARERRAYSGARVIPVEVVGPLADDMDSMAV